MLGHFTNPRARALAYNVFHAYLLPIVLVVIGVVTGSEATSAVGIVWFAHIGMDHTLGYRLKYGENFKHTPRRSRMVRQGLRPCEVRGIDPLVDPEGGSPRLCGG